MTAYQTAHDHAIWIDLSALGRLITTDRDRLDLLHRLSTNDLNSLETGTGCVTILTTAVGRIIDRLVVLNRGEEALIVTGFDRGAMVEGWIRRNIFWNDRIQIENSGQALKHIGVFGSRAASILSEWWAVAATLPLYHLIENPALLVRVHGLVGDGFWIIGPSDFIKDLTTQLEAKGVMAASRADYDALRINAGLPEVEHELTENYIPLEIGLWDAVSFNKGCYIGQEIIARMESRGKLAKMLVKVELDIPLPAGTTLLSTEGKTVGTLTSVATLENKVIGLAVVKTALAEAGQQLKAADTTVSIIAHAGTY